jgi:hypothetical protein
MWRMIAWNYLDRVRREEKRGNLDDAKVHYEFSLSLSPDPGVRSAARKDFAFMLAASGRKRESERQYAELGYESGGRPLMALFTGKFAGSSVPERLQKCFDYVPLGSACDARFENPNWWAW